MEIYNRNEALLYAKNWAYSRNPRYANFDKMGGDCTNFISQCVYAGIKEMNYKKDIGWYFSSLNNRAPAWSGVEELYRFLTTNKGMGPKGKECLPQEIQAGDIVQLSFDGAKFGHSLFVVDTSHGIKIATHTDDNYNRNLNTYNFAKARYIKIRA